MDALGRLPPDVGLWAAAIRSLDEHARREVGEWVVREWVEGRLEVRLLHAPVEPQALVALREQLVGVVAAAGADELEVEWGGPTVDETLARRWCWIEPWILLSQDEDLFLMDDRLVAPLLEEAGAGCPKRSYVFSIVEHHVRDQAHASLRGGPDSVRARLRELAGFRASAVAAGHGTLAQYLSRLEAYVRPGKVREDEARARVSDLWRCHSPAQVDVEPYGRGGWRAMSSSPPSPEEWIVIDGKTGAMHLAAPSRQRRGKKRRRK